MTTRAGCRHYLTACIAATLLATTAQAYSPKSVRKLDPVQIQAVSDKKLCEAMAVWRSQGRSYPNIDGEVARRGLGCAEALEQIVSNCSELQVVGMDGSDPRGVIFTVQNRSPKHKRFRIYAAGIQSSAFLIAPGSTQSFGVAVDPRLARIGSAASALQGAGGVELNECVTATWGF
jgi:hypothetical protein